MIPLATLPIIFLFHTQSAMHLRSEIFNKLKKKVAATNILRITCMYVVAEAQHLHTTRYIKQALYDNKLLSFYTNDRLHLS
mmetsp:Transcript_3702/g.6513  ORF Transcript_3702/g.6513 Transcript_3702/m.6513 type:complete len:81 (-) Transcript_3702:1330-1572(-)